MSRTPEIGTALFNTEASWAEVSTTFGTRVQTIGTIDVSKLEQAKLTPEYTTQLRNEIMPGVNGVFGGEFEIEMRLTGHGSTTAGAITLNALETLLGIFLGAVAASRTAGGTLATAGGTVTELNVAAVNGYNAGGPVRLGSIGDGRGGGQFSWLSAHSTSVITLLHAIAAALNANDVVYNPAVAYTLENPTASMAVTPTRWRFLSGNLQYDCRGCYPKAITITGLSPSEEPTVKFRFGVSYFIDQAVAMPDATSVQTFPHAAVSCGSLFMNSYGTSTRDATSNVTTFRKFELTYELGISARMGGGGLYANQVVVNAIRTRDKGTVSFVMDAPDATATPDLVTKWTANSPLHLAYTWSAEDGKAGGLYLPYVVPDGPRPVQFDQDGINSLRFTGRFGSDRTKTTDLERSALRVAQA